MTAAHLYNMEDKMRYKMKPEEWLKFQAQVFEDIKSLTESKNRDYTAGSGDPFANFRGASTMGINPLAGLVLRMDDKFQRVKAYLNNGELAVQDEGLDDAFRDIIGYATLALGMIEEERVEECRGNEHPF